MRLLYIILIGLLVNSCMTGKIEKLEEMKQLEFNQVVDDFFRFKYYDNCIVQLETKPVFKIHPYYIYNPDAQNEPYPPPPTNKIIYSTSFFNTLLTEKKIDSIDAQFMHTSIDSTLSINIESISINATFIRQEKIDSIFEDVSNDGYTSLERLYNSHSYLTISTPVFNEDLTKMIITVEHYCGALCGHGYVYVLTKQNNKWRIIYSSSTWIS